MELFSEVLVSEVSMMQNNNVKLSIVGDRSRLPTQVKSNIHQAESQTAHCAGLQLNVAIDYSGQWELVVATKKIVEAIQNKQIDLDDLTEDQFQQYLIKEIQTPVDLLIRTSGEKRISNFMIWQLSYAELYFCQKYWPDFSKKDFQLALDEYQKRIRRFGKTDGQLEDRT